MTRQLTRSDLLRRAAVGGAALVVPGALAAMAEAAARARPDASCRGKTFVFSNWPLYIDVDEKTHRHPSLDQFTKKYGVKVKYIEDINDNASFFGKIQAQLRRGQSIGRDMIVMTDNSPYPALLVKNRWVEKLDKSVIPNIKNLVPGFGIRRGIRTATTACPGCRVMTGIGYNAKLTKPVTTVDQLLTDKSLKGKVTLLNEMADTLAWSCSRTATTRQGRRRLVRPGAEEDPEGGQVRPDPPVHRQRLLGPAGEGRLWAAIVWSGDMVQLHADNKYLRFVIPKSGGMIWTDNMLIPKGGDAYHGVGLHELRLRPEDRGADRGLRQLHLPGPRGRQGAAEDRPRGRRRTR